VIIVIKLFLVIYCIIAVVIFHSSKEASMKMRRYNPVNLFYSKSTFHPSSFIEEFEKVPREKQINTILWKG
jgi:hypothetical protein